MLSESVRVAGDEISDSIGVHLKKVHNLVVGERTAEDIKIRIGSAFPDNDFDQTVMDVRGLHLLSGLPRTIQLQAGDLREAIAEPLNVIVEAVKRTLERTPPELAADIVDRGIMLAGGGALVRGISDLISHETGIFTHVAEDPLLCVVNGCGQVLEDYKRLQRVLDTPNLFVLLRACNRDGLLAVAAGNAFPEPETNLALAGSSWSAGDGALEQGRRLCRCLCLAHASVLAWFSSETVDPVSAAAERCHAFAAARGG